MPGTMTMLRLKSALSFGGLSPKEAILRTWDRMTENEVMTRAAAIAFYAMLALVPFLGVLIILAVQLLPEDALIVHDVGTQAVSRLEASLQEALPESAAETVAQQIERIRENPPFALLSIGILVALWTSSSLFVAVIDAMDRMYGVDETRPFLKLRLVALLMTLVQSTILISTLVAIVAGPEILKWFGMEGTAGYWVALAGQYAAVVVMVLLSFALTYYIAPNAEQKWEWITPGSLYGSAILIGFTVLFRVYVQNWGNYETTYGSLAGVMILLLWLWVAALVLLAGAQMNQVIEESSPSGKSRGQKFDPTEPPDLAAAEPHPMARD